MLLYFVSCKNGNDNLVDFKYDPEVIPTMITDSAYQLLSDSGVTRYKISYDVWMVFDKAKEPYQFFPKGLYLERFTPDFTTEATVEADTAWYFDDKKLWRLRSNVHVRSEEHTSELQSRPHLVCRLLLEKKKIHISLDGTCSPSSNHTRRRSVSIYDPPLHLSHSYLLPYCVDLHLQSMHQA